jgi:YHS domain-containing protein
MKHIAFVVLIITAGLVSCNSKKANEVFITEAGAINGYDPVAYFKSNQPVKGNKEFNYEWNGATWYFSTMENLNEFKNSPEIYMPQYGGYCAYGTADGHKAPTQPDAWTVVNNKLYLNYDKDVMTQWRKDTESFIIKADENWDEVRIQPD